MRKHGLVIGLRLDIYSCARVILFLKDMKSFTRKLSKLSNDKHGAVMGALVIGAMVTVVIVLVVLMVTLQITGQMAGVSAAINYGSLANNATAASIFTSTFGALSLMSIEPYIVVAAVLIASIVAILAVVSYRR